MEALVSLFLCLGKGITDGNRGAGAFHAPNPEWIAFIPKLNVVAVENGEIVPSLFTRSRRIKAISAGDSHVFHAGRQDPNAARNCRTLAFLQRRADPV
jgi:hypothetical protein